LFADAFVGFVEFTPIPAAYNTGATTTDTVLVALNQKTAPPASGSLKLPTLNLGNYGNDWTATAFNTLAGPDTLTGTPPIAGNDDEYKPSSKIYKTVCDELWQITTTAVQCVRVSF